MQQHQRLQERVQLQTAGLQSKHMIMRSTKAHDHCIEEWHTAKACQGCSNRMQCKHADIIVYGSCMHVALRERAEFQKDRKRPWKLR